MDYFFAKEIFLNEAFSKIRPVESILDIGTGIVPHDYVASDVYICTEPYAEYVQILQKKVSELKDRKYIVLHAGWNEVLNIFPPKSVDTVYVIDVIEHLEKDEGMALLKRTIPLARKQVVVFTPYGFVPQHLNPDGTDAWGLHGADWQEHRSGWYPSDFGPGWEFIACKNYHDTDNLGRPIDNPSGAFWAIKNIE